MGNKLNTNSIAPSTILSKVSIDINDQVRLCQAQKLSTFDEDLTPSNLKELKDADNDKKMSAFIENSVKINKETCYDEEKGITAENESRKFHSSTNDSSEDESDGSDENVITTYYDIAVQSQLKTHENVMDSTHRDTLRDIDSSSDDDEEEDEEEDDDGDKEYDESDAVVSSNINAGSLYQECAAILASNDSIKSDSTTLSTPTSTPSRPRLHSHGNISETIDSAMHVRGNFDESEIVNMQQMVIMKTVSKLQLKSRRHGARSGKEVDENYSDEEIDNHEVDTVCAFSANTSNDISKYPERKCASSPAGSTTKSRLYQKPINRELAMSILMKKLVGKKGGVDNVITRGTDVAISADMATRCDGAHTEDDIASFPLKCHSLGIAESVTSKNSRVTSSNANTEKNYIEHKQRLTNIMVQKEFHNHSSNLMLELDKGKEISSNRLKKRLEERNVGL